LLDTTTTTTEASTTTTKFDTEATTTAANADTTMTKMDTTTTNDNQQTDTEEKESQGIVERRSVRQANARVANLRSIEQSDIYSSGANLSSDVLLLLLALCFIVYYL
jgi:1,4-dihydroxy-2-naphthoate octaprenyltransferase